MDLWSFCKCETGHICPICKLLVLAVVAIIGGIVGYMIARKRK